MADDKELLKEIWEGKLPVCLRLAQDECGSSEPDEVYIMVARQTYFPLVTDKTQRYFSEYISAANRHNPIWLDFNGTPLKWNYPVGLLYDLYASEGADSAVNLPWNLNVHFEKCPEELLDCSSKELVESFFLSTIKEADALKHRGKVINDMLKKDHKQLWYGIQSNKFDEFWSVNRRLMETGGVECFRSIPFRIYQNDKPFVQRLFEPLGENGRRRTFGDLLRHIYGDGYKNFKCILVQGVTPPLDTPIQWMSEHLSYPDNFLHICVK